MQRNDVSKLIDELRQLQIRSERIIAELESARQPGNSLKTGDRVYIINRVTKPATWITATRGEWDARKERHATVQRIVGSKVYIVTDNGTQTWRKNTNLRQHNDEHRYSRHHE